MCSTASLDDRCNELRSTLGTTRALLHQQEGRRQALVQSIADSEQECARLKQETTDATEAQKIAQAVAHETQAELRDEVTAAVTSALQAVYPFPYALDLDFVDRRGKTDVVPSFLRADGSGDNSKLDPMTETGGGVVDLGAFALRLCMWSLSRERTRPTFLLDEPFKWVSRDLLGKVGSLLGEVATQLDAQFIIITHDPIIARAADKVFSVRMQRDKHGNMVSEVAENVLFEPTDD